MAYPQPEDIWMPGEEREDDMTKFFYDTEFLEDGKTIDLISIGIVREDGATYYAVNREADWDRIRADPWLSVHVVPQLPLSDTWKPKAEIRDDVYNFLDPIFENPELWAWYAAYDHVALCQLFGKMIDLPDGIPMYTNDLKQVVGINGIPGLPEQSSGEHDALADAHHLKRMYEFVAQNGGMSRL